MNKTFKSTTGLGVLDIELSDSLGDPIVFTPNRMAVAVYLHALPVLDSPDHPSVLTDQPGVRLRTSEIDICLTKAELERLFRHDLKPEEVRSLIERCGVFHEVHDDFYDHETFETLQPMEPSKG